MIFCFRWVIILMKREFEFDDVMRLWEVLWTNHLSNNFLVFVCVGILHAHRSNIMAYDLGLDGLLKVVSGTAPVGACLSLFPLAPLWDGRAVHASLFRPKVVPLLKPFRLDLRYI